MCGKSAMERRPCVPALHWLTSSGNRGWSGLRSAQRLVVRRVWHGQLRSRHRIEQDLVFTPDRVRAADFHSNADCRLGNALPPVDTYACVRPAPGQRSGRPGKHAAIERQHARLHAVGGWLFRGKSIHRDSGLQRIAEAGLHRKRPQSECVRLKAGGCQKAQQQPLREPSSCKMHHDYVADQRALRLKSER